MIRYGTSPIAWSSDDDHSLGGDIPLEQCLEDARRIGFDGIEKGHKFPADIDDLRAALAPHGLAYISGWHSLRLLERSVAEERNAMKPHLEVLQAFGSPVCIVSEITGAVHTEFDAPLSSRPVLASSEWPEFCARVEEVARYCSIHGVRLAYHHHMGTVVETEDYTT